MRSSKFVLFFLFISLSLLACEGGEKCGPGSSPLADADSDCVTDESDNCPLTYNPAQADGDEDGVGFSCDSDDANDAVAVSLNDGGSLAVVFYLAPQVVISAQDVVDCRLDIISCNHEFLGKISSDGLDLVNKKQIFFDDISPCSALNPDATLPPALFCEREFVGHLTTNPDFVDAINPCELIGNLATGFLDLAPCQ